jgi:hypothetical protein
MTHPDQVGLILDPETKELLKEIAVREAGDARPSASLTVRRMIRRRARKLGIAPQKEKTPKGLTPSTPSGG